LDASPVRPDSLALARGEVPGHADVHVASQAVPSMATYRAL